MHSVELTHVNEDGQLHMVDVGDKPSTKRTATAHGCVRMRPETLELIQKNQMQKGDVLAAARLAGILAAKQTDTLIPLCHSLPLSAVDVQFTLHPDAIDITATTACTFQTGVEMEALTAVSVAALTIYDMCKAVDRGMEINEIYLVQKSGGRSGTYQRSEAQPYA